MTLLIFVSSVIVAVILERQARLHRQELVAEYKRVGIAIPRPRPKLKRTEAWMNVGLGFLLILLSLGFVRASFEMRSTVERTLEQMPEQTRERTALREVNISVILADGAFLLAGGVVLVWLGRRAIREITRYESGGAGVTGVVRRELAVPEGAHAALRSAHLRLTAAVAAGAFCAGVVTGYLLLSGNSHIAAPEPTGEFTVSLNILAMNPADIPGGFSDELERQLRSSLSSIAGVRVVESPDAACQLSARLMRDDGFITISWKVVRTRGQVPYYNRAFTLPADAPATGLSTMISAVTSTLAEKRITSEFERILKLPENSLD